MGHSLGAAVHGYGTNLDAYETRDPRPLTVGSLFTLEPGIYLPSFGVRSESDVYLGPAGPEVTTETQREMVVIPPG